MDKFIVDERSKREAERLIENLSEADRKEADKFLDEYRNGTGPGWHRFLKGVYNQPITWWIGIIQLQMQMGMWGEKRKGQAQLVANQLGQSLKFAKDNGDDDLLLKALKYNLKYKKADIVGRFVGGAFTNYASKGGKLGSQKTATSVSITMALTNFVLASYGACIKAVGSGYKKPENVIQSIMTGYPNGPTPYPNANKKLTKEELELLSKVEVAVSEMNRLSNMSSSPTPISVFCTKPQNKNLTGLCK